MPLYPIADAEFETVAALVNAAYRGIGAAPGWTSEEAYIGGERASAESLRGDLAAAPGALLLVLRDAPDTPIIGCVWMQPGDQAWHLGLLTVSPALQDRKLGRTLLSAAENLAASRGARRMHITVVNQRDALIGWYERRGYGRTGEAEPFPTDSRFGPARRDDLAFVVLEKGL